MIYVWVAKFASRHTYHIISHHEREETRLKCINTTQNTYIYSSTYNTYLCNEHVSNVSCLLISYVAWYVYSVISLHRIVNTHAITHTHTQIHIYACRCAPLQTWHRANIDGRHKYARDRCELRSWSWSSGRSSLQLDLQQHEKCVSGMFIFQQ